MRKRARGVTESPVGEYDEHPTTGRTRKRMLDQLRRDIQARLDQLLAEADRLRRALAALSPRDGAKTPAPSDGGLTQERGSARSTPATPTPAARKRTTTARSDDRGSRSGGGAGPTATAPVRTAPGATKTAVLAALAGGEPMTASEVASATGLGRASVSTTLSKLAKSGEITKAARGYQIAGRANSGATVTDESEGEQAAV